MTKASTAWVSKPLNFLLGATILLAGLGSTNMDFLLLPGLCEWLETTEQLDELLPPPVIPFDRESGQDDWPDMDQMADTVDETWD